MTKQKTNFKEDDIFNSIESTDYDNIEGAEDVQDIEQEFELLTKQILKKKQNENLGIIRDNDYHLNIYFVSTADKIKFLELFNIKHLGEAYINGYELAKELGKPLEMQDCNLPKPEFVKNLKLKK